MIGVVSYLTAVYEEVIDVSEFSLPKASPNYRSCFQLKSELALCCPGQFIADI